MKLSLLPTREFFLAKDTLPPWQCQVSSNYKRPTTPWKQRESSPLQHLNPLSLNKMVLFFRKRRTFCTQDDGRLPVGVKLVCSVPSLGEVKIMRYTPITLEVAFLV